MPDTLNLRDLYSARTRVPGAGSAVTRAPLAVSRARPKPRKKLKGTMASAGSTLASLGSAITSAPAGFSTAVTKGAPAVYNYFRTSTPGEVFSDVKTGLGNFVDYAQENPGAAIADMVPFVGDAKAVGEMLGEAARLRDAGQVDAAQQLESFIAPIATVGFIPEAGALAVKGARSAIRRGASAAAEDAALAARPAYTRAAEGPFTVIRREGLETQPMPEALETNSLAALRGMAQDRTRSPAILAADQSSMAARGVPYDETAAMPVSSLQRQAGIGRAYQAAVEGSPEYKSALFERYGEMMPQVVEQARAQNLDQLTEAAYRQLGDEVTQQFDRLPLEFRYHGGEGEYGSSTDMLKDALGRGRLNVFSGGEPHEFLSRVDPATGLSQNEQFRAVHDYMGHVVPGSRFGPSGEEIAYAAHAQQLSPLALLSETRGQNSFVNYSPINAGITGEMNALRRMGRERKIAEKFLSEGDRDAAKWLDQLPTGDEISSRLRELGGQTQYAPQRAVLLPPEYLPAMTEGGTPDWLRGMLNPADALNDVRGVHISRSPDLEMTDPSFYGRGHQGAEYRSTKRLGLPDRTYFYSGPEGTVVPEEPVMGIVAGKMLKGPRYAYEADLGGLYDVNADPSGLAALAKAYNLPDYKPVVPYYAMRAADALDLEGGSTLPDLERMIRDYGYKGYISDYGRQRAAAMFDPVTGLRSIERGPQGFAEGGYASGNSPCD